MSQPELLLDTPLAKALRRYFQLLEQRLELSRPVTAYLAGGMAAHLYTGQRVTTDIDAEFSQRMFLPTADLWVSADLGDGRTEKVYLDTNYNGTLGLMHEDAHKDAIPLDLGLRMLDVRILTPVDLAVSKISRFGDRDKQDIHDLVVAGLTSAKEIEQRASQALDYVVGNPKMLRLNIQDAVTTARAAENQRAPRSPNAPSPL